MVTIAFYNIIVDFQFVSYLLNAVYHRLYLRLFNESNSFILDLYTISEFLNENERYNISLMYGIEFLYGSIKRQCTQLLIILEITSFTQFFFYFYPAKLLSLCTWLGFKILFVCFSFYFEAFCGFVTIFACGLFISLPNFVIFLYLIFVHSKKRKGLI